MNKQIIKLKSQNTSLETENDGLKKRVLSYHSENAAIKEENENLVIQINEFKELLSPACKKENQTKENVNLSVKGTCGDETAKDRHQSATLENLESKTCEDNEFLTKNKKNRRRGQKNIDALETENETLKNECNVLTKRIATLEPETLNLTDKLTTTTLHCKEIKKQNFVVARNRDDLQRTVTALQADLDGKKQLIENLKSMFDQAKQDTKM